MDFVEIHKNKRKRTKGIVFLEVGFKSVYIVVKTINLYTGVLLLHRLTLKL